TMGGFFGMLAGIVLCVVLVVSLIGIPGFFVVGTLLFFGACFGYATSAWWIGSVLPLPALRKRPVLQLAAGVGALFFAGLVPKIGTLVIVAAVLAGLGAVIATNFGK